MITIGITGGIGSGKSVVSRILLTLGIPVYDSDSRAKWLNDHSPVVRQALTDLIGSDLYENDILRRDRLATAIFSSGDLLEQVNEIIHPEVKKDFCQWRSECGSLRHRECHSFQLGIQLPVRYGNSGRCPRKDKTNAGDGSRRFIGRNHEAAYAQPRKRAVIGQGRSRPYGAQRPTPSTRPSSRQNYRDSPNKETQSARSTLGE